MDAPFPSLDCVARPAERRRTNTDGRKHIFCQLRYQIAELAKDVLSAIKTAIPGFLAYKPEGEPSPPAETAQPLHEDQFPGYKSPRLTQMLTS